MSRLDNLPDELFLDHLLPVLPIADLLSFAQVNRHLEQVTHDRTFWKRKIKQDFNLPPLVTAREDGWKELYSKLRRPSVYVWGASSNGRLGIPQSHPVFSDYETRFNGVNRPVLLPLDEGAGMVDLQASGYGFCGLDSKGRVWVWGTLDGESYTASRFNWMDPATVCREPHQVLLPTKIISISCGRRHILMLDEEKAVWEFTAWGKATKFDPDLSSSSDVIQVEAGWGGSTSLSSTGQVSVWWPKYDTLDPTPPVETPTGSSQITVGVTLSDEERFVLPDLPRERGEEEDKIGRIACGDSFLVALTEKGEVWTAWLGGTVEEIGQMTNGHGRQVWEHHPRFEYSKEPSNDYHRADDRRMTHISAHFETFFVYHPGSITDSYQTSIVLKGTRHQLRSGNKLGGEPTVLADLQGKGVIQVAVGDYHFAALTAAGSLLTFGQANSGALGLGPVSVREITTPTTVQFEEGTKFVFAIAASGWHTGALVADMSPKPIASNVKEEPTIPLDPPRSGRPIPGRAIPPGGGPYQVRLPIRLHGAAEPNRLGFLPGMPAYARVGLAGAGAVRRENEQGQGEEEEARQPPA